MTLWNRKFFFDAAEHFGWFGTDDGLAAQIASWNTVKQFEATVEEAKEICEYRGEELYVERVNGEWDFDRIRRIFHDGNGVKVVKMQQKI